MSEFTLIVVEYFQRMTKTICITVTYFMLHNLCAMHWDSILT